MTAYRQHASVPRRGTILIITAGLAALMASLALTFLIRMQSDAQESLLTMRDAQARIMLVAACHYLQEASRIGYDDSQSEYHKEAYGWIDIRDGAIGPKPSNAPYTANGGALYGEAGYGVHDDRFFPVQSVRIFPMHATVRPPFAISPEVSPNPIDPDAPSNGTPWLVEEDPKPPRPITALPPAQQFAAWKSGDPTPRAKSQGRSWFRLLRCGPGSKSHLARYNAATFIVTVGAGGTHGFRSRDWNTMSAAERGRFGNDKSLLATLEADEVRYWYLVEWNPAIGDVMTNAIANRFMSNPAVLNTTKDKGSNVYYPWSFPQFASAQPNFTFGNNNSPWKSRNFGGTISFVQRLQTEPPDW